MGTAVTGAHTATVHRTLIQTYPEHEPRESDPHYAAFDQTRRRLERLGALRCWINNADCCDGPIELHHSIVEFSLVNITDAARFRTLYPEFHLESDEAFLTWVNSEGNLLPLCREHHRGHLGIHSVTYPAWLAQRFMRSGTVAPERSL
jgi:hypothetical protein